MGNSHSCDLRVRIVDALERTHLTGIPNSEPFLSWKFQLCSGSRSTIPARLTLPGPLLGLIEFLKPRVYDLMNRR